MSKFILFQKNPDCHYSKKAITFYWIWNILFLILFGVGIGIATLFLSVPDINSPILKGFFEFPLILLLNTLPPVLLIFLLYGIFGRGWIAFAIDALIFLGLAMANYYKLNFRNDTLIFSDIFLAKEAGNMAGKYHLFLDQTLLWIIIFALAGTVFLFFFVKSIPSKKARIIFTICALVMTAPSVALYGNTNFYTQKAAYYEYLDNPWFEIQRHIAHGCTYAFLYSISDYFNASPPDYSKEKAEALLKSYKDADIPQDKKVNVIGIMLEAYNDFTKFENPQISPNVYEVWHQLEAEGYSGNLVTDIFAAGTVSTERSFLTGYLEAYRYFGYTNSYPWYFQSQGYRVEGMHPSYQWFYNRNNINDYLGFNHYYFVENYFGELTKNNVAMDNIFFPELLKTYTEATNKGTPYFNFSVTYQGHGPYATDALTRDDGTGQYSVLNRNDYTEEEFCILENYFDSIANTNKYLKEFTDYLRKDDEPVILVLFGDHNPWLGDNGYVYETLGISFDMTTKDGFMNYFTTPYIIWANDAAKAIMGNNFQGEGPDIGPNFLMNQVFTLCGWEGPSYMQATKEVAAQVPVIHEKEEIYIENGQLTTELSPYGKTLVNDYFNMEYYWRTHFAYTSLDEN